jgi:Xaa-Pro aminopeptidase
VIERPSHGSVVIDAAKWRVMNRHDRTLLYLHEVGHSVGLDHPQADDQIMSSGAYDGSPGISVGT